jgi:Zinc finger, C2H2 type
MNNPYKKMIVLTEEEYFRLKHQQQQVKMQTTTVDNVAVPATTTTTTTPAVQPSPHRFVCKICGKTYKQKRDLRRHVKLVHASLLPPKQAIIPIQEKEVAPIKESVTKKKKKQVKRIPTVFDSVHKWMTIHD